MTDQKHPASAVTQPLNTRLVIRDGEPSVAFESTLLVHGVPREAADEAADRFDNAARTHGATPKTIGLLDGRAIVGLTREELATLHERGAEKVNLANLPLALVANRPGATTVSATLRIAAAAGIRVFATGAMGGVHDGYGQHLDVSTDLTALAREPVALVSSGVKSVLDVVATRELLETLGVPVLGYRTDRFPAFYARVSEAGVDATYDDIASLAEAAAGCIAMSGRGVLIANPIPEADEIPDAEFAQLRHEALSRAAREGVTGRAVTPFVLSCLHEISGGRTLGANLALAESNAAVGAAVAVALERLMG